MYSTKPNSFQKFSIPFAPYSLPPASSDRGSTGPPLSSTFSYYDETTSRSAGSQLEDEPPRERDPWSSGLFDCFSDWRNCCMTFWCPCVTFGQIAEIVDKGSSACGVNGALYTLIACVTFCPCCYSCFYRAKMRQDYFLRKKPCNDCCVHCFCECCALCQEYRELKFRGYDMTVGWHGNVEKKHRALEMASQLPPVVEEGMSR